MKINSELLEESAAMIERLRSENERLRSEVSELKKHSPQYGRWFRWNRDNGRGCFVVCLLGESRVAKYSTQDDAEKAVAGLDELVGAYIRTTGGTECSHKGKAVQS